MYRPIRRTERTVLATAAVFAAALGISAVASAFVPSDPHVGVARANAVLERAAGLHDAAAMGALRIASVQVLIR